MIRAQRSQGFSLLELIIVVVMIALMAAYSIHFYLDAMAKARATTVEMTAWRFGQSAAVLRAWSRIPASIETHRHGVDARGVSWVFSGDTRVYLNENSWPANTDSMASPKLRDQTASECAQLLQGILQQPLGDDENFKSQFTVSVVGRNTCRYQLTQNTEEAWFFDYSPETGQVRATVPRLRIEQQAQYEQ